MTAARAGCARVPEPVPAQRAERLAGAFDHLAAVGEIVIEPTKEAEDACGDALQHPAEGTVWLDGGRHACRSPVCSGTRDPAWWR